MQILTKDHLRVALDCANNWALWSTFVLGVGILGEYVLELLEQHAKPWWKWLIWISVAVMVISGISGEYWFSRQISNIAGKIQTEADLELSDAEKDASNANGRAIAADNRAVAAYQEAKQAIARARRNEYLLGEANKRTAKLNFEAALTNQRAGVLEKEAEQLRRENLAEEAVLAPRNFKDEYAAAERLKVYSGTEIIVEYISDEEVIRTAEQIAIVLKQAGWHLQTHLLPNSPDVFDGIRIDANIAGNVPDRVKRAGYAMDALIKELQFTGIQAEDGALPATTELPLGTIEMQIGMKADRMPRGDRVVLPRK
jgi:hypothetical protein